MLDAASAVLPGWLEFVIVYLVKALPEEGAAIKKVFAF